MLVAILGLSPIVATLGTNTLLMSVVFAVSGGIPRSTTDRMAHIADGRTLGIPNAVYFAVGITIVTTTLVKMTVFGRHFEAVGANPLAMWTTGLRTGPHRAGAYVWAQLHYWLGGVLLAGIVTQPTASPGTRATSCHRWRRSCSAARRWPAGGGTWSPRSSPRPSSPSFEQFVLALGIGYAYRTLIEAAALAVGIALYSVNWGALLATRRGRTPSEPLAGPVQPSVP